MNRTEYALERILKITWEIDDSKPNSHLALMREYLHRMGIWAKRYDFRGRWPFFDVALLIAPDIRAPEEFVTQISGLENKVRFTLMKTCIWYLHWNAICDAGLYQEIHLPEPYEPLIIFYERGGYFTYEYNFIDIGERSVGFSDIQSLANRPEISIDKEYLDALDEKMVKG